MAVLEGHLSNVVALDVYPPPSTIPDWLQYTPVGSVFLWFCNEGNALVTLHTGEVQGSIPCAPTIKAHDLLGFLIPSQSFDRQYRAERYDLPIYA
jgi:hypothetical protein